MRKDRDPTAPGPLFALGTNELSRRRQDVEKVAATPLVVLTGSKSPKNEALGIRRSGALTSRPPA
jgi:hypothetical protein